MVMTHLAYVTDRIDRSYSPRGGREERELDVWLFKDRCSRKVDQSRDYCRPGFPLSACMITMIRFSFEIATHNRRFTIASGMPTQRRVLPFHASESNSMKRLLPLLACTVTLAAGSAYPATTVSGKVSFVTKRGQNPVVTETLVWLEPATGRNPKRAPATYQMVTRGKALVPHVLAIPVGSTVEFPNDDPISHNLFSLSSNNSFDLGLYRRGAGKAHTFDTPGTVNVYCNVHPNMSAVIQVMATPYFDFADGAGNYAITDVPPGKYRLVAWNEQGGETESPLEVTSGGAVNGNVALLLDSRNFRLTQHMNKLGKPYQAPSVKDY
jgi:plastocyanin